MKTTRILFAAAIAVALVGTTAQAGDGDAFPADKHPWAQYGIGTTVTYEMTMDMGAAGKIQQKMVHTLTAKTADNYTVDTVTTGGPAGEQKSSETETLAKEAGTESIEVAGTKHETTKYVNEKEGGAKEASWFLASAGAPIKIEASGSGQDMVLNATSLSEKVTVGDKTHDCVKLEGTMKIPAQGLEMKTTFWFCGDVPGGLVKMTSEGNMGGMALKQTLSLAEFEKK